VRLKAAFASMSLLLPAATYAQGMPVVPYAANFAQTHLHNQLFVQPGVNAEIRRLNRSGSNPTAVQNSRVNLASMTYRADKTQRRVNIDRFLGDIRKKDAAGAAQLANVFANVDVIGQISSEISRYGLSGNNVADAYAVYWISAWEASKGIVGNQTTREQSLAVRDQAARAFQSTPAFAKSTNAERQEFAEMLLLQAALISSNMESTSSDKRAQRELSNAIRQGATAMGLDLDAMTLTDQGFVPSGKTGAADPAPGAPEQALAANDAPVPAAANDTSPPYLLMAAAGGAGIGGVFLLGKMMGKRG
jgi:hypothetical protein